MTTINRSDFVKQFADTGINVNDLSPDVESKLTQLGLTQRDLLEVAGKDGRISGESELNKLFNLIDKSDHDGSSNSFTMQGKEETGVQTKSGAMYDALKTELELNRTKAHTQGIIHLGMRKESTVEADALARVNPQKNGGIVRIEAFKSDGVIKYAGKEMDLKTDAGRTAFRDALISGADKLPKAQAQKFVDYLGKHTENSRDDLAELGLALLRTGKGQLPVSRLVISGHGMPGGQIFGENSSGFEMEDVADLAAIFPDGAKKIEHIAVAACYCAGASTFESLQRGFPQLKSAFAYTDQSPKAEKGASYHLTKWEGMTDGKDPSQVDPPFEKTATWNKVDGYQGLPQRNLADWEKAVKQREYVYDEYKKGGRPMEGARHDWELDDYYGHLAALLRHPDISPQRKLEVEARIREVLKMRHPELPQG